MKVETMRHPYATQPPKMEGYFPERDALQQELNKLNQVIRSHRTSEVWKKFSLSTSNNEYGGVHNLSRKERERGPYYNPWFQSSGEIGKYFKPIPKKELEKIQHILDGQKSKQEEKKSLESSDPTTAAERGNSESNVTTLPPIQNAGIGEPAFPKPEQSRDAPANSQHMRQELKTGAAKNYMMNPMGRFWQNISEIPGDSGRDKRTSPKKRSPIGESAARKAKQNVKVPAVDKTLRYGIGGGKSTGVPKCSHLDLTTDISIPSADSKGSSLN